MPSCSGSCRSARARLSWSAWGRLRRPGGAGAHGGAAARAAVGGLRADRPGVATSARRPAWERPGTVASGIADPLTGYPEEGDVTVAAIVASGGAAWAWGTTPRPWAAISTLAATEGLFQKPSSAIALAGLEAARASSVRTIRSSPPDGHGPERSAAPAAGQEVTGGRRAPDLDASWPPSEPPGAGRAGAGAVARRGGVAARTNASASRARPSQSGSISSLTDTHSRSGRPWPRSNGGRHGPSQELAAVGRKLQHQLSRTSIAKILPPTRSRGSIRSRCPGRRTARAAGGRRSFEGGLRGGHAQSILRPCHATEVGTMSDRAFFDYGLTLFRPSRWAGTASPWMVVDVR